MPAGPLPASPPNDPAAFPAAAPPDLPAAPIPAAPFSKLAISTKPLSAAVAPTAERWVELLSAEAVSGTAISGEAVSKEPASEEALSAGTMAPRRAGFGMTCDSLMHACWNKMGTQSSEGCSGRSAPIKRVFGAKSGTVFSGGSRRALLSAPPRHAPVAQLDRALPSEGRGHRFESCRVHHHLPFSPQTPDIYGEISSAASQL